MSDGNKNRIGGNFGGKHGDSLWRVSDQQEKRGSHEGISGTWNSDVLWNRCGDGHASF